MPDGATHYEKFMQGYRFSVPLSFVIGAYKLDAGVAHFLGYSAGRYFDPDMDIMGTSESEGRMVRELPIVGWILFGVSSIYGSVFRKMHRSWLTHLPVVSTAIRLAFFFLIPIVILDQLGFYVFSPFWLEMYAWFWCGLSEADAIHYLLDKDSSSSNNKTVKKKYNSGRK